MEFNDYFFTMKPIQLPWAKVSPANAQGLDYHLSPNLTLRIEGIFSGDQEFFISEVLLRLENMSAEEDGVIDALMEEQIFQREIMPNKTQGRISRHFKEPDISVFFTAKQMAALEDMFNNNRFIAQTITVLLNGNKVNDIYELGPQDFRLVLDAFDDLEIDMKISHKESKEEFMEAYNENFEKKVAAKEDKERTTFWEKISRKGDRKRIIKTVLVSMAAVGCWIAKKALASQGWKGKLCAVPIGVLGVILDMYSQTEMLGFLRGIQIKNEGMY